jgi:hypothetical protein
MMVTFKQIGAPDSTLTAGTILTINKVARKPYGGLSFTMKTEDGRRYSLEFTYPIQNDARMKIRTLTTAINNDLLFLGDAAPAAAADPSMAQPKP